MTVSNQTLLAERYGTRQRRPSRRAYWIIGACALAVGAAVAYLGYVNLGSSPIDTQVSAFENVHGTTRYAMRVTFDVTRDTPERPAVCIVRVRALDGNEGGRKEVLIPPGGTARRVSTVVESTEKPVTADVFGCSYQVPSYLSTDLRPSG